MTTHIVIYFLDTHERASKSRCTKCFFIVKCG